MKAKFFASALAFVVGMTDSASAEIITYDGGSGPGFAGSDYQFSSNVVVISPGPGSFWPFASAHSGCCAALNDYLGPVVITQVGGGTFSFVDTYITGWNTESIGGTITGYLNNTEVGSVGFSALGPDAGGGRPGPVWALVTANFSNVDTVVISEASNNAFLLDDTEINAAAVPLHPLPLLGQMLLLALGGFGLLAYRRRNGSSLTRC
jgi:hypothetical protein